jgi:hypothetical protein
LIDREWYVFLPGARTLGASKNVRYYRTTFFLPAFGVLWADVQAQFDNVIQIFVNGHELALEGEPNCNWSECGPPFRLLVEPDGSVTNGHAGGRSYGSVAASFPITNWISDGVNELVVAVNNYDDPYCPGGEDCGPREHVGAFTFLMSVETAPYLVPTHTDQCKKGGWQVARRANGTSFENQGDCIQYVNTGR